MLEQKDIPYIKRGLQITAGIGVLYGLYRLQQKFNFLGKDTPKALCTRTYPRLLGVNPYTGIEIYFDPIEFAKELRVCMQGVTPSFNCEYPFRYIAYVLDNQDLRCLHNAFRIHVDKKMSLFQWIDRELPTTGYESEVTSDALNRLKEAGVGNYARY